MINRKRDPKRYQFLEIFLSLDGTIVTMMRKREREKRIPSIAKIIDRREKNNDNQSSWIFVENEVLRRDLRAFHRLETMHAREKYILLLST